MRSIMFFIPIVTAYTHLIGSLYPSFRPIDGIDEIERQINAEEQCNAICSPYFGWSGNFICDEIPMIDAFRNIYFRPLGCVCECNDS